MQHCRCGRPETQISIMDNDGAIWCHRCIANALEDRTKALTDLVEALTNYISASERGDYMGVYADQMRKSLAAAKKELGGE